MVKDLSVTLGALRLDNPVIPASGTFAFGAEHAAFYDLNILGSISVKGTTIQPRDGNSSPRIAECAAGLLNSVGLQNPGAQHVRDVELKEIKRIFHKPVLANISGFSVQDYVDAVEILNDADNVGIMEINISCPNVHGGGMAFGTDPKAAAEVTAAVKKHAKKPVYIKLSPNVTDITAIARACEDAGADGLSLINTLLGMRIDLKRRAPVLANKVGGYSGPGVFPVALRMVWQVSGAVKIPVIEMLMAGAKAVQVGSANLHDPCACKKIIEDLPRIMDKLGIDRLSDIRRVE